MRTTSTVRLEPAGLEYPSLFGRHTIIFADHARLDRVLVKMRQMGEVVARCDDFPAELRPPALLRLLLTELQEHFEREESEEYFGTLASHSFPLRQIVFELRAEHAALLRAVRGLLQTASIYGRERELAVATEGLLGWLGRHEERETRLMNEFLSGSDSGQERPATTESDPSLALEP